MAQSDMSRAVPVASRRSHARRLQFATLLAFWALWEGVGASGLLYTGVVPSTSLIVPALGRLIASTEFWFNLSVTGLEIGLAVGLGAGAGICVGLLLGGNRFLGAAFEPQLAVLAATPKIILLPILYLMLGIGPASKIAIGAFACFVPVALSTASGMREVSPVFVSLGRSLDLSRWQMTRKIYLPALVEPIATGLRVGLGAATVVCLVAEIKFSRNGLGAMVIDSFDRSRFAEVYAVLAVLITLAIAGNGLINRLGRTDR